jgi:hypothetical protein
MENPTESKAALLPDAGEPLELVGTPRGMRGEFRVQNATERKIIVQHPVVRTAATTGTESIAALPTTEFALRRIIVRPGQSRPVPVALTLDPRTPPGTYEALLDVDGEQRNVIMHVTEDVALSISPQPLVIPNRPKEKVRKQVVFTNDGNVPITVKSIGTVVLDDEMAHCRAMRGALTDVGDTMEDMDDYIAALGKRYRKIYDTLVLKVQNDEITINPGETRALQLNITVPDKLEKRSRYSGYAAIATSNLTFIIVPD